MIELPVISTASDKYAKKPNWLRVKLPVGEDYANVRKIVDENKLHTICESGNCPNMGECWGAGTATALSCRGGVELARFNGPSSKVTFRPALE